MELIKLVHNSQAKERVVSDFSGKIIMTKIEI